MASVAGPMVYWCHQCNVETRPAAGDGDDVLCTFCNQGFIEELHGTEVEPGVAFSTLPLALGSFLRRPSPTSVGTTRDRSATDPSVPPSSSLSSSQSSEEPQQQIPSQTEPQGHPPRLLSGQLSGVPSLFEAMMQALEEMNGSLPSSRTASADVDATEGHAMHGMAGPELEQLREGRDDSYHGSRDAYHGSRDAQRGMRGPNQAEDVRAILFPPTLILHGDMPSGLRSLEVFVDHGHGMGPQMMPSHVRDYFFGPDLDRLIQMLAENDPNRYGTPPAAKAEVEKLPKLKVTEEHLGSEIAQCAVCQDDFEFDAEVRQMPCKHIYHPDCILPWLAEHNSCPICRFELPTDDADYEARKGQSQTGGGSADATESQGSDRSRPDNLGSRAPQSGSNDELPLNGGMAGRQFTLWGMPALGFDMNRVLNPSTGVEDHSDSSRESETGQNQSGPREQGRRDGVPVHWLFRLFSSGNSSVQDDTSSGNGSPEQPS